MKFGPSIPKLIATWPGADVRDAHRDEERADPVRAARSALIEIPSTSVPTPPSPVPRMHAGPLGLLALDSRRAGRPGPSPRASRRARTGCSGRSAASPCGRGRRSRRSPRPRPRSWRRRRDGSNDSIVRTPDRPATQPRPRRRDVVAERRDQPHPGHDDPSRLDGQVPLRRAHRTSFPVRTVAAR